METLPNDLCVIETENCIKKLSASGKYIYKPKDLNYFIEWRKNHKVMTECEHCQSIVVGRQMKIHQRSRKCEFARMKTRELNSETF